PVHSQKTSNIPGAPLRKGSIQSLDFCPYYFNCYTTYSKNMMRFFLCFISVDLLNFIIYCGFDKPYEQRVGSQHRAFVFMMKLSSHKPRVILDLDDLYQFCFWIYTRGDHPVLLKLL